MTRSLIAALLVCASQVSFLPAFAAVDSTVPAMTTDAASKSDVVRESTMPPEYKEVIKPELAAKYSYKQDGEFTAVSQLPTYEWMPTEHEPKAIVVGIHGLTLHGRRYRVLARMLAVNGIGFVAMDMRGFGRCRFDTDNKFSTPTDDKTKISYHNSYDEIVKIVTAVKQRYPGRRLIVMGESLGCTFAVRVAAEHQDLVDGIILSAPAVKLNPKMYVGGGNVAQGVKAIVSPGHSVKLNSFIHNLVSDRTEVVNEMLDDPHILKSVPLLNLLATDEFVAK
ncbi:MAG: lysophospholipase, partial [Cyanobacteria bacterium]|nr:lysophospholipase [Cyanobacteriota bacterium]